MQLIAFLDAQPSATWRPRHRCEQVGRPPGACEADEIFHIDNTCHRNPACYWREHSIHLCLLLLKLNVAERRNRPYVLHVHLVQGTAQAPWMSEVK